MKKIIIPTLLVLTLASCEKDTNTEKDSTKEEIKTSTTVKTSNTEEDSTLDNVEKETDIIEEKSKDIYGKNYFYVDGQGKVIDESQINGRRIIEYYTAMNTGIPKQEKLTEELEDTLKDEAVIKYHIVSAKDDNNDFIEEYSNKAGGFMLAVIKEDPKSAFAFYSNLLRDDYFLQDNFDTYGSFENAYLDIGGTKLHYINDETERYFRAIQEYTEVYEKYKNQLGVEGTEDTELPLVYIRGQKKVLKTDDPTRTMQQIIRDGLEGKTEEEILKEHKEKVREGKRYKK